jgi:hypothetical protein
MMKKKPSKEAIKHGPQSGLQRLKAGIKTRGMTSIDGRCRAAKAVKQWKAALVKDLGGAAAISAQRMILIDSVCGTLLLLRHADAFLASLPFAINKSKRTFFPLVSQRMKLQATLHRELSLLGLQRQSAPAKPLAEFIADLEREETQQLPNGKDAA